MMESGRRSCLLQQNLDIILAVTEEGRYLKA